MTTTLYWLRNDLRLHDNPALLAAAESSAMLPVFAIDPRWFADTGYGFPKMDARRLGFLIDSLVDLKWSLRALGSDLHVEMGSPSAVIGRVLANLDCDRLVFSCEVTVEERDDERAVRSLAQMHGIPVTTVWQATLHHVDDLPFAVKDLPEVFTQFRKQVEKHTQVRAALPSPDSLPPVPASSQPSDIPIDQLPCEPLPPAEQAAIRFQGGETAARQRLQYYVWETDALGHYKKTRNQLLGDTFSSKFSPWLANGCLSPRSIFAEVQRYEQERKKNASTYWMIFELRWRDYFRFIAAKHGSALFLRGGLRQLDLPWRTDAHAFQAWCEGRTGYPLVDANMRELAATGFMSNRGRQNVASFLTKNLGIDWRWGAAWFESRLLDHDPCSNYGNWNYAAGIGNDPRGFRFFNITSQGERYDKTGQYVRHWLPELADVADDHIHQPWRASPAPPNYPPPMVDLATSAAEHRTIYDNA